MVPRGPPEVAGWESWHGALLRRVRPEKIAGPCSAYFRPAWQQLLREIDHLGAAGG